MASVDFNPVVVAPTYNNARTLCAIIDGVRLVGVPLIVVNDGSTDETATILAELAVPGGVIVVTHSNNLGKAAALRSGFDTASELGFTHVITIDTDGQHDPAEIPKLVQRARSEPQALILGLRDESVAGYPSKSRLGRRVSNLFIRMECGQRVEDSQCGMRVYPIGLVKAVRCRAGRYGFESEIVTRAAWAGCPIVEVPVACCYLPAGERVSHLHPVFDTFRGVAMHVRLLARAMMAWPRHPQWPNTWSANRAEKPGIFRRLIDWLNPADAWRQVRAADRVGREHFAAGLALGAFIGNLPTYGLHAFIGLFAARRLHLHPVAVVIGTNISTPPVGPILNAAAIGIGYLILHGKLPSSAEFNFRVIGVLELLRRMLFEWIIGAPIMGLLCAYVVFVVSNRLLKLAAKRDSATAPHPDTPGIAEADPASPAPGPVV